MLSGLFYDYFTEKWGGNIGPPASGLFGVVLVLGGYGTMWLGATHRLAVSVYSLGAAAFVMGQGSGFLYIAALNPNAHNFGRENEGRVR